MDDGSDRPTSERSAEMVGTAFLLEPARNSPVADGEQLWLHADPFSTLSGHNHRDPAGWCCERPVGRQMEQILVWGF
jgi:hypothetical protein